MASGGYKLVIVISSTSMLVLMEELSIVTATARGTQFHAWIVRLRLERGGVLLGILFAIGFV